VQVCTYLEHDAHTTVTLGEAMDSQRKMLAALLDGVDEYVVTLKRTIATVRELSDDMRSNYRYKNTFQRVYDIELTLTLKASQIIV